ncbi:MAG: hypothetical protein PHW01_00890 [Patescibacteria group bacterium]|nr:hypothetical protein [Patescibacteria group bacterium]
MILIVLFANTLVFVRGVSAERGYFPLKVFSSLLKNVDQNTGSIIHNLQTDDLALNSKIKPQASSPTEQTSESHPSSEIVLGDSIPKIVSNASSNNINLQNVTTNGASTSQDLSLLGKVYFGSGIEVKGSTELQKSVDVGGNFTVGTKALYVDTTNDQVGIGTKYPQHKLDVAGNVKVGQELIVIKDAHLYNNLTVDGQTKLTGILEANGGIYIDDDKFIVNGKTGDVETAGTLRVHQDAWFNRNVFIGNGGTVNYATGDGDLYVEDVLEVDGTIYGNVIGTITPGFTQGSVVFTDAAGALAQDNANFYWDDTNNRLGVGTTTPGEKLEVVGNIISKGTSWIARTATEANTWNGVAYGNGLFVAVSYNGTNRVMTSPDGITWTARTAAEANGWNWVTYGNGLFVAVAETGTHRVMTSPDGITWTARTAAEANKWEGVTYGNGLFVAVAYSGTHRVMTSPDGITWTARTAPEANSWYSVTYGNGLFVAVAYNGTNRVMTSPDGITWTARTAAEANTWYAVTYGNGLFVAVGHSGTHRVMTSPDGITWTARTAVADSWNSVTYGNGLFVAVGLTDTNRVMTSPDGITWTTRTAPESNWWMSVTYGNGLFVAVSWNWSGGTHQVMTSGKSEMNVVSTNHIYQGGMSIMSGNVGIGTSTPDNLLSLNKASGDPILDFKIADSTKFSVGVDDSDSDKFKIETAATLGGATPAFVITSTGAIGIGTSAPGTKFVIANIDTSASAANMFIDTTTGSVYRSTSSLRYKDDVQTLQDDFTKILEARPTSFIDKATGKRDVGFIAEEFDALGLSNLVIYDEQGRPDAIKYERISLYQNEVLKEQQQKLSVIDDNMQLVQNELGISAGDTTSRLTGLELGIGNQESGILSLESRIKDQESRIQDLETRITNYESQITENDADTAPAQMVEGASSEQVDLESLQSTLQTLVDSLSNLENVSNQLNTLSASILTVMESNQANTARIQELEEETQNLQQIVKIVEDKVIIGDPNKYLVLDAATGLEINSENFAVDKDGNVKVKGELKLVSGRILSETGILELNPGEANDTVPEPKVVVKGDLEVVGKITNIITGTGVIEAGKKDAVFENEEVTKDSFIGITPLSSTFIYLSEVGEKSFTVSALEEVSEDTEFNWWIIKEGGEKKGED